MGIICTAISIGHGHVKQFFASLAETRSRSVILNAVVLQIVKPLLYWSNGNIIELVHPDDVVFGEHILRGCHSDLVCFLGVHHQIVASMYTRKHRLAMIEIVAALAKVKIDDVD